MTSELKRSDPGSFYEDNDDENMAWSLAKRSHSPRRRPEPVSVRREGARPFQSRSVDDHHVVFQIVFHFLGDEVDRLIGR